eukprot:jgi/Mesen1/1057/ME000123S00234
MMLVALGVEGWRQIETHGRQRYTVEPGKFVLLPNIGTTVRVTCGASTQLPHSWTESCSLESRVVPQGATNTIDWFASSKDVKKVSLPVRFFKAQRPSRSSVPSGTGGVPTSRSPRPAAEPPSRAPPPVAAAAFPASGSSSDSGSGSSTVANAGSGRGSAADGQPRLAQAPARERGGRADWLCALTSVDFCRRARTLSRPCSLKTAPGFRLAGTPT